MNLPLNPTRLAWVGSVHKGMYSPGFERWYREANLGVRILYSDDTRTGVGSDGKVTERFWEWAERLLRSVVEILTFCPKDFKALAAQNLGTEMYADLNYRIFVLQWMAYTREKTTVGKAAEIFALLRADLWTGWGESGEPIVLAKETERALVSVKVLAARGMWDPFGTGFVLEEAQFQQVRTRFDDSIVGISVGTQVTRTKAAIRFANDLKMDTEYAMYAAEFTAVVVGAAERDELEAKGVSMNAQTVTVLRMILRGLEADSPEEAERNSRIEEGWLQKEIVAKEMAAKDVAKQQKRWAEWALNKEHAENIFRGVDKIRDDAGYRVFFTLVMEKIMSAMTRKDRCASLPMNSPQYLTGANYSLYTPYKECSNNQFYFQLRTLNAGSPKRCGWKKPCGKTTDSSTTSRSSFLASCRTPPAFPTRRRDPRRLRA
jgi:hypothetical protein